MIRREAPVRISREELYSHAIPIFTESLGVERDEVVEDAALGRDLGAESIDILDISFRLERAFNVSIPQATFLGNYESIGKQYKKKSVERREPTVRSVLDCVHQKIHEEVRHG